MKKVWENPELNGLGVNETNEAGTIARYDVIATSDMKGTKQWVCLGVFDIETGENKVPCGQVFGSYSEWALHAGAVHAGSLIEGEGTGVTPIS